MKLEELITNLRERLAGREATFSWVDRFDGSQIGAAFINGALFATWEAELANKPIFDGKTPRGPRCYRSLRFFDGPTGNN